MRNQLKIYYFIVTLPALLSASQAQNFGLGGTTTGRVSAVIADPQNAFAAAYNPALIARQGSTLFSFSTSSAHLKYTPLENIRPPAAERVDSESRANYELPSTQQMLWAIGFTYPFELSPLLSRRGGFGITFSGPYNKIRSFLSHTPDEFYSFRYGNADSQLKGTLALSLEIVPETIYFGAGTSLFLSGAGAAEASLNTENPTSRMALDVGLNSALVTGVYAHLNRTTLAFTFHQELDPQFVESFDGSATIAGSKFHQPILIKSSLYYEPHAFEVEAQHAFESWKVSLGISYQIWSRYKPPILVTETIDSSGEKHTTLLPEPNYRSTLNPRVSVEIPFLENQWSVASGYQYRPTPVADLSGPGNALDSDAHIVGISLQRTFLPGEWMPWPTTLGLFGQYHWLTRRSVVKADPQSTGAPNYTFSANAYTYGISLLVGL